MSWLEKLNFLSSRKIERENSSICQYTNITPYFKTSRRRVIVFILLPGSYFIRFIGFWFIGYRLTSIIPGGMWSNQIKGLNSIIRIVHCKIGIQEVDHQISIFLFFFFFCYKCFIYKITHFIRIKIFHFLNSLDLCTVWICVPLHYVKFSIEIIL